MITRWQTSTPSIQLDNPAAYPPWCWFGGRLWMGGNGSHYWQEKTKLLWGSPVPFYAGQTEAGTAFSPSTWDFPCQHHPTITPFSNVIHVPPTLYDLNNRQLVKIKHFSLSYCLSEQKKITIPLSRGQSLIRLDWLLTPDTRWFKYDRDWFVCKQAALRSSCATLREWSHNLHPPSCSG